MHFVIHTGAVIDSPPCPMWVLFSFGNGCWTGQGSNHLLAVVAKPPGGLPSLMYRDVLLDYVTTCITKRESARVLTVAANSTSLSGNNSFIFKCTAGL